MITGALDSHRVGPEFNSPGGHVITYEQASNAIDLKVVYRAPHVPMTEPGEEGVITSVNLTGAFVRYGAEYGSKHTQFDQLTLVSGPAIVDRPDAAIHFLCPADTAPAGATHHLVPSDTGTSQTLRCRYCKKTEREIRAANGL